MSFLAHLAELTV